MSMDTSSYLDGYPSLVKRDCHDDFLGYVLSFLGELGIEGNERACGFCAGNVYLFLPHIPFLINWKHSDVRRLQDLKHTELHATLNYAQLFDRPHGCENGHCLHLTRHRSLTRR